MGNDKLDSLGRLYADLGGELARIVGGNPDGIFLYAEAGEGWVGASIFKDEGDVVQYFDPSPAACELLMQAWKTENSDSRMRWSVMSYEINGTRFNTKLKYPDEIEVKSFDIERREAALRARFGDKPVIYPPPPSR